MREIHRYNDGTTRQGSLRHTSSFREAPEHNLVFPIEAIVVRAIYPSEDESITKRVMEYHLSTLFEGIPYLKNVPVAQGFGFYGDGEEVVLQAALRPSDSKSQGTVGDETTLAYEETDGDRVLVSFIHGSVTKPIIIARLSHQKNPINSTTPEKKVEDPIKLKKVDAGKTTRTMVQNGTKVDMDEKGNLALTFGKHLNDDPKDPVESRKKLTIFKDDGKTPVLTIVNSNSGWKIDFGGDGSASGEKLVLGDALKDFLESWRTKYEAHKHLIKFTYTSASGTGVTAGSLSIGPTGSSSGSSETPSAPNDALPQNHDTYQSNWITSEQDAP